MRLGGTVVFLGGVGSILTLSLLIWIIENMEQFTKVAFIGTFGFFVLILCILVYVTSLVFGVNTRERLDAGDGYY